MVTSISIWILIVLLLVFSNEGYCSKDDHRVGGKRSKRMVGGFEAAEGAFPYQVSLRKVSNGAHFCSGSILRPSTILTASHCASSYRADELFVVAGSNQLSKGGTRHYVIIILTHANYVQRYMQNDIAFLIIFPLLVYSETIRPIALETSYIGPGVQVTVSGWGRTNPSGSIPDKLQFLNLTTLDVSECRNKTRFCKECVTESTICTLNEKGEGLCKSDSGGPLVANGRQIGIVSWGDLVCAVGYPDVYTRISSFVSESALIHMNNRIKQNDVKAYQKNYSKYSNSSWILYDTSKHRIHFLLLVLVLNWFFHSYRY